jgi:GNAT superfamily N-acetyltransferase
MEIALRAATSADLPALMAIWHATETINDEEPTPVPPVLPEYPHLLRHGQIVIADIADQPRGFIGSVVRSQTLFITDLFVDPAYQSVGIGTTLLRQTLAAYPQHLHCTVSSADLRAHSLYIRAGMQPYWPNYLLRAQCNTLAPLPVSGYTWHRTQPSDPAVSMLDSTISGRVRPMDLAFWEAEEEGSALLIEQQQQICGYAIVRQRAGSPWLPGAIKIGPVGGQTSADASAAVQIAVDWAKRYGTTLRLDLPGPHPALPVLVKAGFRVMYIETFVARQPAPFDPRCYAGSGGALL